jgi:hypothetical protein
MQSSASAELIGEVKHNFQIAMMGEERSLYVKDTVDDGGVGKCGSGVWG